MATKKKIITEKELLSMSEDEYMNEDQLAFFRARLEAMEAQLRHNAGQTTETLRQTQLAPDPLDRATIEEEHALELRTRDRERKLLKKVQAAIKRIDEGEYGWCAETGEPIGVARLLARPTATLSLEAQQRRELKQKMYNDDRGSARSLFKKRIPFAHRRAVLFFLFPQRKSGFWGIVFRMRL